MHFTALKVFCDVARQRSFSQAAQACGITQSAVSQIVSQLEKRMQVQLVDRSTRPLQLTPLGQAYYEGCKAVLEQFDELEASIKSAREEVSGTVQVAAIYSVGLGDMEQYVRRFVAEQATAQVHIDYLHPDRVYERVREGTADLGLVSFPRKSAQLVALPWRQEEMVLVCSAHHTLARNLALQAKDLAGQKYVHFDRNLVIRRQVDRFLRDQEVAVEVVLEFDNIENIKQAVTIDAGVALLPEPTVRAEARTGTLAALPLLDCHFTRPLGIIHRRRQRLSAAARRFLQMLLDDHAPAGSNGDAGTFNPRTPHPSSAKAARRGRNGTRIKAK